MCSSQYTTNSRHVVNWRVVPCLVCSPPPACNAICHCESKGSRPQPFTGPRVKCLSQVPVSRRDAITQIDDADNYFFTLYSPQSPRGALEIMLFVRPTRRHCGHRKDKCTTLQDELLTISLLTCQEM